MSSQIQQKNNADDQSGTLLNPEVKVSVEIDYDKLADAIVKAQKKAVEEEEENTRYLLALQKNGAYMLYNILGKICFVLSLFLIAVLIVMAIKAEWSSATLIILNVVAILLIVLLAIFIFLMSVFLHKSSKEIEKINDKQMLIMLSSSITSFIALVVAIIAIFVK